jgi:1-acyl-sn-glycerol-3-phosphate acyltransferase
VQVELRGPLPDRATLVVANHLGYVDILALLSRCPMTFVAKSEIARWPIVGRLAAQAGLIFINRQRLRDVHRVKAAMQEALAAGHTVAYFPEGTSSNGRSVLPFRTGLFEVAFATDVPVMTAAISGWAAGAPPDDRVCWHGDTGLLPHVYRLAATRHHGVTIRFGRLDRRCPERRTLAATARQTIMATRAVPIPPPCYYPRLPWSKGGLRWSR